MATDTRNASTEAGSGLPGNAPPRENVCRAFRPGYELRASEDGGMPTMVGHFAVFNQWTEINSMWEGNFLERIAPGAFKKTFAENREGMRVLFQHGNDPVVGDKPLGPIQELREDDTGGAYEVPLLDTSYVRDLLPGLEAGLYGASFRFKVMREDIADSPKPSAYNPRGLPERTIREAQVMEFGPVTFPAYAGATAGVRSLTDEFLVARMARNPEQLAQLLSLITKRRFDTEDVGCVSQMLALASEYLSDQDETDDAAAIETMQGVVETLNGLLAGEIAEVEPPEADDEGGRSTPGDEGLVATAPSTPDAASGTSGRSAATSSRGLFLFTEPPAHLKRSE